MSRPLKKSELNHLRLLLGWVNCEIGQTPMEVTRTILAIGSKLGNPAISDDAKGRLVDHYRHAESVPKYVRAAVEALTKLIREQGASVSTIEIPVNRIGNQGARNAR